MASKPSRLRTKRTRPRHVSQRTIAATVRQIAEQFKPEKIILFGSYAYGKPTPDSDVDLLVVMETPLKESWQAFEIRRAIRYEHPLDLIVKTPETLDKRIKLGDLFLREIIERGKTVYERNHS